MPDTFNRIQAGTKATTLGAFAMLIGVGIYNPDWLLKVGLIIVFIAISNPIGSSVIAKATYKAFGAPENLVENDMEQCCGGNEDVE
jgi:multicomponent Na+:H+ antiporter subunit G